MKKIIEKFRAWQRENPEWELICDIKDSDSLYIGWEDLTKKEKRQWEWAGDEAKEAFEEFGVKKCIAQEMCLTENLTLCAPTDWPPGINMLVFKTGVKK